MSLHDFACADCGLAFEELVRAAESALCPECRTERVERRLCAFAVHGGRAPEPPGACST